MDILLQTPKGKKRKTLPDDSPPPTVTQDNGSPPTTGPGPSFSPLSPPSTVETKEDGSIPTTDGKPTFSRKRKIFSRSPITFNLEDK